MALSCPACDGEMLELDDCGVRVDVCTSCSGLWLDRGELSDKGGALPPQGAIYKGDRRCPRCGVGLHVRTSKVVELDVCLKCSGVFLDAGEIELLLGVSGVAPLGDEASEEPLPPSPTSSERLFRCQICYASVPLDEQVIGEHLTACRACAVRLDIHHDPAARRRAELARQAERDAPDPLLEERNLVSELLFGRKRQLGRSRSPGLVSLLIDLL